MKQNGELGQKAIDSFKSGDIGNGIAHTANYLANAVPGLGAQADQIGQDLNNGDYGKAGGHLAAIAALIEAPKAIPAVGRGIAAGGADIAKGAAKIAGGEAMGQIPGMEWPGRIALGYPGARQIMKGIEKGAAAAKGDPASLPVVNLRGTLPEIETAAPVENPLLDEISMGMGGKKFDKLDAAGQETVRNVAEQVQAKDTAPAPPPPPVPPSPLPRLPLPRQPFPLPQSQARRFVRHSPPGRGRYPKHPWSRDCPLPSAPRA